MQREREREKKREKKREKEKERGKENERERICVAFDNFCVRSMCCFRQSASNNKNNYDREIGTHFEKEHFLSVCMKHTTNTPQLWHTTIAAHTHTHTRARSHTRAVYNQPFECDDAELDRWRWWCERARVLVSFVSSFSDFFMWCVCFFFRWLFASFSLEISKML